MTKVKSKQLKKHVGAIHSNHSGGLLHRKLCNALLANAYEQLAVKETHHITISELSGLIGYKSNDTQRIKKALIGLQQTNVQWNVINPETGKSQWGTAGLLGEAVIEEGVCFYSYSPHMRKILFEPEKYGRIDLGIQAKFKSSYGLALYENTIRYQDIPQTPWFEIEVFKKLMGVPEGKYNLFRDLKKRVIEQAVKEVNEFSNIKLEFQLQTEYRVLKEGRRRGKYTKAIRFLIKNKKPQEDKNVSLILINEFELSHSAAWSYISKYGATYVREKIDLTKRQGGGKEGLKNKTGFLLAALKNNYALGNKSVSNQVSQGGSSFLDYSGVSEQNEKNINDLDKANKVLLKRFDSLPVGDKKSIVEKFEAFIDLYFPIVYEMYKADGQLDNPIVKAQFCEYLNNLKIIGTTKA